MPSRADLPEGPRAEDARTKCLETRGDHEHETDVTAADVRRWPAGLQPGSTNWPQWPRALHGQATAPPRRHTQHHDGGKRARELDHLTDNGPDSGDQKADSNDGGDGPTNQKCRSAGTKRQDATWQGSC